MSDASPDIASELEADALEIASEGLAGLLQLLEVSNYDDVDSNTLRIPMVVALTSLMMSSHPLVPLHGGKLVCALLLSVGWWDQRRKGRKQPKKGGLFLPLAMQAAAVALVLGGRRAEETLTRMQIDVVVALAERCTEIQECAKVLHRNSVSIQYRTQ